MAPKDTFTPKASLTEAPTNLKEAIDWVLRVTGRDGKKLDESKGECICGLAAAVTDLLQSVELEYNGYEGESKGADTSKGAKKEDVDKHLNGLFSLVQGLGGTAVVRTYIDQLAQVLSALIGWSSITKCGNNGMNDKPHGDSGCKYLEDKTPENKCDSCGCMKWKVFEGVDWVQLGRGCTRCKDSGGEEEKNKQECKCGTDDEQECSPESCKCAKAGKCCKCCCKGQCGNCKRDAKCSCITEEDKGTYKRYRRIYNDSYQSAYSETVLKSFLDEANTAYRQPMWKDLKYLPDSDTPSQRRHQCARILLGSVCLIWSGMTYMHWTGKWNQSSAYWNNHILDGSGLDDKSLSQWLQALGFPREMLNDKGPKNRLDQVIWDGFMGKLFLGFTHPSGSNASDGNTAKQPYHMNYAGFVHTAHRDSFNNEARVFSNGTTGQMSETDQNKMGAIFKLYILSCAYFTGLQKRSTLENSTQNKTPKTIREILYWLSALPYSPAYKEMLDYAKRRLTEVTKKPGDNGSSSAKVTELKFHQTGRWHPITVHEFNLFAHFQAVTQYCPLVLIGIQGGLHSAKGTEKPPEPAIHSLYANTECHFTYPTVSIQAYNQVVHYIRALFYQLYFLRKQCAVKVTCGGKWRECRYGNGVVSKGVISWMCLGCNPMEHDRNYRVKEMEKELDGMKTGSDPLAVALKTLLEKIGDVVVQLGNAQEALEGKKTDGIKKVKTKLEEAKGELDTAKGKLNDNSGELEFALVGDDEATNALKKAKEKLDELTNGGGGNGDLLGKVENKLESDASSAKDNISAAINKVREALNLLKEWAEKKQDDEELNVNKDALLDATKKLEDICNNAKCNACGSHSSNCGRKPQSKYCDKCHQQYMDGFPSPLQAFLEDRLPGFSCEVVRSDDKDKPDYPLAASHLGHCGGSGQCCPLPMGFRNQFQEGITHIGQRLYGILYFFSGENMMQSCVYTLVRVTAALSATTPQVLGDVFGFFRGGVGNKDKGETKSGKVESCGHTKDPSKKEDADYFCGWCASGLRDEVQKVGWIPFDTKPGGHYRETVGKALIEIKGDKNDSSVLPQSDPQSTSSNLSTLTSPYLSPLTGELYTAVSATFGGTYLSWVLYLSDALEGGLKSLSEAFRNIECRGCKGQCDPNRCKKGEHGNDSGLCGCQSIVSCTGVLPVLYRHGFSYGNPFNLEGYRQENMDKGDYSIENKQNPRHCHEFLESLGAVIDKNKQEANSKAASKDHPLTNLITQVGKLQYDIRLPWIFVLTIAWLVAVLYLAFGAIWPLDWTHMRSHWLRGGAHQWQCMWDKVMTGRKGVELVEYFGRR